jgi:predicted GTPase
MLASNRPVVAVCAVRTGAGKSQTSRAVASIAQEAGLRVALVRHPMPYGDLEAERVQRFATLADIDAADPTIEEREEYERPVEMGVLVFAGVDYEEILRRAEAEADLVIWDGGNNDVPFFRPDVHIVVTDPLRAGDELGYFPGEANLRMADVVLVNKLDSASPEGLQEVLDDVAAANPGATVIRARSPVTLEPGPPLEGKAVLVVEDGPTITHGEMSFGAGTVAARAAGAAELVDPRPSAVGSIADTFSKYGHLDRALPAMGYSEEQLRDLEATVNAVECDVVVAGTPMDLTRLIDSRHPIRGTRYELEQVGDPRLEDVLAPVLEAAEARP